MEVKLLPDGKYRLTLEVEHKVDRGSLALILYLAKRDGKSISTKELAETHVKTYLEKYSLDQLSVFLSEKEDNSIATVKECANKVREFWPDWEDDLT